MLPLEEAIRRVVASAPPPVPERVALEACLDRVLAEPIQVTVDLPPWTCSAMDGYAVHAADLAAPGRLAVGERLTAGRAAAQALRPGVVARVFTGAPVPAETAGIALQEEVEVTGEGQVRLTAPVRAGAHLRWKGEDLRLGDPLLPAGARLGSAALGLMASQGLTSAWVARRPRVAILGTGDELTRPGDPLGPASVYASNGVLLVAAARQAGAEAQEVGLVADVDQALRAALEAVLSAQQPAWDLVVTTGGVSVGDADRVRPVLAAMGAEISFSKVNLQPGKPLTFARLPGGLPFLGLPGNPVSAAVGFAQVIRPWIRKAMGDPRPYLPVVWAVLDRELRVKPGRAKLVRVELEAFDGGVRARPVGLDSSGALGGFARAQGLALVDGQTSALGAGDRVRVQVLDPGFADSERAVCP